MKCVFTLLSIAPIVSSCMQNNDSQPLLLTTQNLQRQKIIFQNACAKSKITVLNNLLKKPETQEMLQLIETQEYDSLVESLHNNLRQEWQSGKIAKNSCMGTAVSVWVIATSTGFTALASMFFIDDDNDEAIKKAITVQKYCLGTMILSCVAAPMVGLIAGAVSELRNGYINYQNTKVQDLCAVIDKIRKSPIMKMQMVPIKIND